MGDRALQILQLIGITLAIGAGGWTLKSTVDIGNKITRLEEHSISRDTELLRQSALQVKLLDKMDMLQGEIQSIDRRVTIIETRTKP